MRLTLNLNSIDDYALFLKIKALPRYQFQGREAIIPDEYVHTLNLDRSVTPPTARDYQPIAGLFDYQRAIVALATRKRKIAVFAECGLGKDLMMKEFVRNGIANLPANRKALIVCPLMVIDQALKETRRWYGDSLPIEQVRSKWLGSWLTSNDPESPRIGITNYEALDSDVPQGNLGLMAIDESSYMKSSYGKWGQEIIRLGKGLPYKIALTGTPAPNDRIEFANHAVFLNAFPTQNAFLARFFVNKGKTGERWEIKQHAVGAFYRALSHWCIFLKNPATYGWKDNTQNIPPINIHIDDVEMTDEQIRLANHQPGMLFAASVGGIGQRARLSKIAKGKDGKRDIESLKPAFIRRLVDSWIHEESTIIWVYQNDEQDQMERTFPEAVSLRGTTSYESRQRSIEDFQSGRIKVLISKPKILGFGLNLQIATRQVFNGLRDSWEEFHQCVKRSNRYGSIRPLNVHVPVTDIERPMLETVIKKAARIEADELKQEIMFKDIAGGFINAS